MGFIIADLISMDEQAGTAVLALEDGDQVTVNINQIAGYTHGTGLIAWKYALTGE